jgi:phytoene synthase
MLHLYHAATEENIRMSNAICTALQLINFWQDVAIDWEKDRIYIPLEDMAHFGVTEDMIANSVVNEAWQSLMQFEVGRARGLMLSGAALPRRIPGRVGRELRLVVHGGLRILQRIESAGFDVFNRRPVLKVDDWVRICWRSLHYRF